MKSLILLSGVALLLAASAAGAQLMPSGHSQHHSTKHSANMSSQGRSCEHDMHEMMSMMHQMMKMHGGMKMHEGMNMPNDDGMKMPAQPTTPGQNPPADQHRH